MSDVALKGIGRILGFTGTSQGMSELQKALFTGLLSSMCPEEFHHGDCVGADAEAHDLVRLHRPSCRIVIHPPDDPSRRAMKRADVLLAPRPYLVRNRSIVAMSDEMVACPKTRVEQKIGSGTWATVRYTREAKKPIHMVWP